MYRHIDNKYHCWISTALLVTVCIYMSIFFPVKIFLALLEEGGIKLLKGHASKCLYAFVYLYNQLNLQTYACGCSAVDV